MTTSARTYDNVCSVREEEVNTHSEVVLTGEKERCYTKVLGVHIHTVQKEKLQDVGVLRQDSLMETSLYVISNSSFYEVREKELHDVDLSLLDSEKEAPTTKKVTFVQEEFTEINTPLATDGVGQSFDTMHSVDFVVIEVAVENFYSTMTKGDVAYAIV